MASKNRRRRLLIEPRVQGPLLLRVAAYWFAGMWTAAVLLIGAPYAIGLALAAEHPPTLLEIASRVCGQLWPAFFVALTMMPFALLDILRQSHRIVGPILRVRRALRDLADGKTIEPLHFRKGDYWTESADAINRIQDALLAASRGPAPVAPPPPTVDLATTLVLPAARRSDSVAEACVHEADEPTDDRETLVLSEVRSLQLFSEGEREPSEETSPSPADDDAFLTADFDPSGLAGRDTVEFGAASRVAD